MGWYVGNGGGVSAGGVEGRAVEECLGGSGGGG